MPSVSAIILTRDSQRTIEACIQAIKPAVDHVIVVDTGSTDDTVQIAKANGAYVYHFEWRDDFAAARNFGDSCATSDWVIHVDSDEILREEDTDKIRKLCIKYKKSNVPVQLAIQTMNIMGTKMEMGYVLRMYKRDVLVWKGIIHEHLVCKRGDIFASRNTDVGFVHDGYDPGTVNVLEKTMRNIRLLQKGVEQEPDSPMYHFFFGRDHVVIGDFHSAIPHLKLSLELFDKQEHQLVRLEYAHKLLINCLERVGDYTGAEEIANQMTSKFTDQYPEGWYKYPTPQ